MERPFSVLLVNEDEEFITMCAEALVMDGCRVETAPRDGRRIAERIAELRPALALFDLFLPGLDGLGVIERVRGRCPGIETVFAVVTADDSPFLQRQILRAGASFCFVRPLCPQAVARRLSALLADGGENAVRPLDDEISLLLHRLGMPAHLRGFLYFRTALRLCSEEPQLSRSLTKRLYPAVAAACGTTGARVERAMRAAVEIAWERGDLETLENLFGDTISRASGKPTNGEFIAMLCEHLRFGAEKRSLRRAP